MKLYVTPYGLYHNCQRLDNSYFDSLFNSIRSGHYTCMSCPIKVPEYLTIAFPIRIVYNNFITFTDEKAPVEYNKEVFKLLEYEEIDI